MAMEQKDVLGISGRSVDQLNQTLSEDVTPSDDLVILDERLQAQVTPSVAAVEESATQVPVPEATITVDVARTEAPVLATEASRHRARLLLITKDISFMQAESDSCRRMADLRTQFLEVHIILLNFKTGKEPVPVQRLHDNVWLYTTNSTSWWKLSYDAYILAQSQLTFSGGFRADIILADDPFESGLAAWFLAKKVQRPMQLHITEDFFDPSFVAAQSHSTLYEWGVEYLLNRVQSVRTKTEFQRQAVIRENKKLEPFTEMLPGYYNLGAWRDFSPNYNLRTKYPQFKFIVLHISAMRTTSHSIEVLHGVSPLLRQYPTIGLIMVGNGPLRSVLEKTANALGIRKQVEFEPMPTEVLSHMKTANVFIQLSEDSIEDDLILEAAVSKIPLVASATGLAGKLFVNGQSAALCNIQDGACIAESINRFLNRNQDRSSFALAASDVVFERIEQDYTAYLQAYGQSIERCIVAES